MFSSELPTLAHYFANAGYETVLAGKMHFIGPDQLHGFGRRLTTDIYPSDLAWLPSGEAPGVFIQPGGARPIASDYVTAGIREWSFGLDFDEETHARALAFLRSKRPEVGGSAQFEQVQRERAPFFLCVSYHHPHEPFHVTERMWSEYEGSPIEVPPAIRDETGPAAFIMDRWLNTFHGVTQVQFDEEKLYRLRRCYYALVTYIDRKVGELLSCLEEMGLAKDTMVVFTSDHGDMLGERRMVQKRCFYEWSNRIPLIMRPARDTAAKWPGGTEVDSLVSIVDILPTLCEICDIEVSSEVGGHSFVGLLRGERKGQDVLFGEYYSEGVYAPCLMVRRVDGYKWVYVEGRGELLLKVEPREDGAVDDTVVGDADKGRTVGGECEGLLREKFDPAEIQERVRSSLRRRRVIKEAAMRNGTRWDYEPRERADRQYVRFYDGKD